MRIERFTSTNFRNLNHNPLSFSPGVNLLIGDNGQGKTNILEALFFFKFGRSFRTHRDVELIRFDDPFCRVEVESIVANDDRTTLAVSVERDGPKRIKKDGKDITRYSDLVGSYPCVLFGPEDLELVSGFASERRRFIDMVGSMIDRNYLESVRTYRRILTQRNAALKARDLASAFGEWTEQLIESGCDLTKRRGRLLDDIRDHMLPHIESLSIPYDVTINYDSELDGGRPEEVSREEHFAARLAGVELNETRRRITLVGPHRDDIRLILDGRDLRKYGSQGQRRLMAILLRLAELSYLEKKLAEPCVLMLDDLFSELDETIGGRLKSALAGGRQVFVTSPVEIDWAGEGPVQHFNVAAGVVS